MTNFSFLDNFSQFNDLKRYCNDAEALVLTSPALSAIAARNALEFVIKYIYKAKAGSLPAHASLFELIDSYEVSNFINDQVVKDSLHFIRILGNNAAHNGKIKTKDAMLGLENLHFFIGEVLILLDVISDYPVFDKALIVRKNEERYVQIETIEVNNSVEQVFSRGITGNPTLTVSHPAYMNETKTRKQLIDLYLNEAGWEICDQNDVVVPRKAGIEIKVQGMPNETGDGYCDYVLYGMDGKPLAIVEAKKTCVSPEKGRNQVCLYGECMRRKYGYVPILYYTNGYSIKVIDGVYPDRELAAFHTLSDLERLIQLRNRGNITDLKVNKEITGRPYQQTAITSVCEYFNDRHRKALLVMATGTGKTRVAISLVEILARNNWIKNVLFLADRTALVKQAKKNFIKLLPSMTVCELSGDMNPDLNARLMFSTYQTMIKYIEQDNKVFSTGRFDLIIIDEAHRSIFNKFGSIFTYFDSLLVGLTATPRNQIDASTYKVFDCEEGMPNYAYSLTEAVHDGYLVPYREPLERSTSIMEYGIKYDNLSQEDKIKFEEEFGDTDLEIDKKQIFKKVYNKKTCNLVLKSLMRDGLKIEQGDKIGKTIIFAYDHKHAQLIVECFHNLYPAKGANFCRLIDNYETYADDLIVQFETDPNFQIAVSVDMLDTGIDIPEVLNLVFFKPVKSYIKFVQMIGRGTRLCPNVFGPGKDKTEFLVFDWCHNFDFFSIPENKQQDNKPTKSITQRLVEIKFNILLELQRYENQEIEYNKNYYITLKSDLYDTVNSVRNNGDQISVRQALPFLDKYSDENKWRCLSPVNVEEIKKRITPLVESDEATNQYVKSFDNKIFEIELDFLKTKKITTSARAVNDVQRIAEALLDKASIPQIMDKASYLRDVKSEAFWKNPTLEKIETTRENIRDLMKFLDERESIVYVTDFSDEDFPLDSHAGLFDIRTYRQKVIDYLLENSDNPVINKIKNLEQLTESDLHELETILWTELGTEDDYRRTTNINNLAVFIRSLVGLNQQAINEKFGDYLNGNIFNSVQQEFIKMIIDFVNENGDIQRTNLVNSSPFNEQSVSELFGEYMNCVTEMVDTIHGVVQLAA